MSNETNSNVPNFVKEIFKQDPEAVEHFNEYFLNVGPQISAIEDEFFAQIVDIFMDSINQYLRDYKIAIEEPRKIKDTIVNVANANRAMLDREVRSRVLGTVAMVKRLSDELTKK